MLNEARKELMSSDASKTDLYGSQGDLHNIRGLGETELLAASSCHDSLELITRDLEKNTLN